VGGSEGIEQTSPEGQPKAARRWGQRCRETKTAVSGEQRSRETKEGKADGADEKAGGTILQKK